MANHKLDLKNLEKRLRTLSAGLVKAGTVKDFEELIIILKRPGWTTPAEYILFSALVDSMQSQLQQFGNVRKELLRGGKAVTAG
jgi:hypothetical protein